MKDIQELQDIIRRQAEEIRSLKDDRRFYRRFYMKVMNRYRGLQTATQYFWDFLEEQSADYPEIASNGHAILQHDGPNSSDSEQAGASLPAPEPR